MLSSRLSIATVGILFLASCESEPRPTEVLLHQSCSPLATTSAVSFPVGGDVRKLVADPDRCRLYALDASAPSKLLVVDLKKRKVVRQVALPHQAEDMDLSPAGAVLAVTHPA